MRARETASFFFFFAIAVAILPRDLARMLWWRKQVHQIFRGFIILPSVEGLTSSNRDNSAISNKQWSFPGCLLFENTRKNFKSNLVLVVVLVLESKGLYCLKHRLQIYPLDSIIHFSNNRPGPWVSFIQIRKGNFDFFTDAFLMNPWTELFEAWLVGGNCGLTVKGAHELLWWLNLNLRK